jgi:methyl-accepting chemotaxis protein
MRDLLQRAAQDHVYEQRTQGAVLDEIRQRLEGMEWLLREVRERELGGLSGTLESVNGRLEDIAARPPMWAEGLAQHVEAVRDHVDAVGERVGHVDARVGPITELPSIWADLGTVGENVDEALKRLQSVLNTTDGITKGMSDFAAMLANLNSSMEAAASRFTRLDKSVAELATRTDRVESAIGGLSEDVNERLAAASMLELRWPSRSTRSSSA